MGTNYFAVLKGCERSCKHCAEEKNVHLGKSSVGWRFLLKADTEWSRDNALHEWLELVLNADKIETEYGTSVNVPGFLSFVMGKQKERLTNLQWHGTEISGPHRQSHEDYIAKHRFENGGFEFSDSEFS